MENDQPFTAEISATVSRLINEIEFGSLIFTVQDARIVQLERNEKFQFPAVKKSPCRLQNGKPTNADPLPGLKAALMDLHFGQIVVKIQSGRVVQIDRTEKRRLPDLVGIGGDGI